MYGFYYTDDDSERVIKHVILDCARKQGKSMFVAALSLYALIGEKESAAEIDIVANSRQQAHILFDMCANVAKRMDKRGRHLKSTLNRVKFAKTEGRIDGESNYQDLLTVMSMILDQKGTKDGSNEENINIKEKVPELLKKLFKMTHTFKGTSKQLYPCEKGCRVLFYFCNEEDSGYKGTGIDLNPFQINPHSDFEDYSDEDFDIVSPEGECEICGHNGKGCILDSEKCWHGKEDRKTGCKHYLGKSPGDCTNLIPHYDCPGHGSGENAYSCDGPIGCKGYWECGGHDHWNCPGHFYVCCMGHTDLTINTHIMYIDEIIKTLKNGYTVE